MRYTNVKSFHKNFFEEVKDLPVTVTKYGKPYIVVTEGTKADEAPKEDFLKTEPVEAAEGSGAPVAAILKEIIEKKSEVPSEPDLDNPLGRCMWTKLVSGNRFNCDKAAVKKVDGIPVCEEHAS